jgi:hypothetical protein
LEHFGRDYLNVLEHFGGVFNELIRDYIMEKMSSFKLIMNCQYVGLVDELTVC